MSNSPHLSPTIWVAVIGVIATGVAGFWSYISGRNSGVAVLQSALVAGFKELNDQQMSKIADLRGEILLLSGKVDELSSELAAERQRTISLKNILRREGISIPRETTVATVFTPFPDGVSNDTDSGQPDICKGLP